MWASVSAAARTGSRDRSGPGLYPFSTCCHHPELTPIFSAADRMLIFGQ
jgi:hypothetical protein